MNKSTLFTLIILTFFLHDTLSGQIEICGHHHVLEQMEKQYPGYKKHVNQTFLDAKNNSSTLHVESMEYNIPVVVHVVWKEEEEKINEELIQSQIEILNEDYGRLNLDADSVRTLFSNVVGNPMIRFTLQEIIYTETEEEFSVNISTNELPDNVKVSGEGGSDPVDVEQHLNIWICKIQPITFAGLNLGQVLGYAYPPNDLSNWPPELMAPDPNLDGVVLDYRVVGINNPYTIDPGTGEDIQFTKGRSAVHEVGHYLGLRHVWGDGQFGAADSCNEDDGIEDTPNAGSSAIFNCDTLQNTCSSNLNDLPDMIENFMDYSAETCQNSFTLGQIALMRGVLENQRCNLVNACMDVSTRSLQKASISVQPNPSEGQFLLSSNQINLSDFDFQLYNTAGQSLKINLTNNSLDLAEFPAGIYYLHGHNQNYSIQEKLIKL